MTQSLTYECEHSGVNRTWLGSRLSRNYACFTPYVQKLSSFHRAWPVRFPRCAVSPSDGRTERGVRPGHLRWRPLPPSLT